MLTDTEKWELCLSQAREIVSSYREKAPEGFDPQNTWVAIGVGVAGVAVSAAGTAYSSSQSSKAAKKAAGTKYNTTPKLLDDPKQVDPYAVMQQLYATNGAFQKQAKMQVGDINRSNVNQAIGAYNTIQPGLSSLLANAGQNAQSAQRGELTPDAIGEITRLTAQQGIQGGLGYGSQGAKAGAFGNLHARNLGLGVLEMQKYGNNLALSLSQNAKNLTPALVGLQDFLYNPNQLLGVAQQNTNTANQFALQNNQLLNGGIAAQNQVLANQTQQQYAAEVGQAQAIGQAASSIGGAMSGLGASAYGGGAAGINTRPAPTQRLGGTSLA